MFTDPVEFTIKGNTYRAGKMDALRQWAVVRRLTPLVGPLSSAFRSFATARAEVKDGESLLASPGVGSAFEIASQALAKLTDEDSEFVISACMAVCERQASNGGGWVRVWNVQGNRAQFADIELPEMLQITFGVLRENLSGFFPELLSLLKEEQPAA